MTFFIKAFHDVSPDGDDFVFAYSTDDSNYTNILVVTKTASDKNYQSVSLPPTLKGKVYIRVRDTVRTQGSRDLDAIHIDHMFIRSSD